MHGARSRPRGRPVTARAVQPERLDARHVATTIAGMPACARPRVRRALGIVVVLCAAMSGCVEPDPTPRADAAGADASATPTAHAERLVLFHIRIGQAAPVTVCYPRGALTDLGVEGPGIRILAREVDAEGVVREDLAAAAFHLTTRNGEQVRLDAQGAVVNGQPYPGWPTSISVGTDGRIAVALAQPATPADAPAPTAAP